MTPSGKLTRTENARLVEVAQAADGTDNLPMLQIMRPWLAALTLTMAPQKQARLQASLGIDKSLQAQMHAAGKSILALETAEHQVCLLADMPPAAELALRRATLHEGTHCSTAMTQMISSWLNGDVAAIAQ